MTKPDAITDDSIQERLVALTRDLILIPSIPSRPDDRRRCYELIKNHVESLGGIEVQEFEHSKIPSLMAAPPGAKKPDILMCGHLDVITHPDVAVYRSRIEDGRIYGPGAGDMKGSLAILMEIFRNMHSRYPKASLGLVVTSDEEQGGASGIGYLFHKKNLRCKFAMIPDGGSINEITVDEKGILHLAVSCVGQPAHAARPWQGVNPIETLMEQILKLREEFQGLAKDKDHWHPTCAVTVISTENQTVNRIPADASAVLDIRFPAPFTVKKMLHLVKDVLGPKIEANMLISAEPTHLSPDPLYKEITEKVAGGSSLLVKDDGGSDARYFAAGGIPVMVSRPLVGNLHSKDEWIDIKSMVKLYRIYEEYIRRKLKL